MAGFFCFSKNYSINVFSGGEIMRRKDREVTDPAEKLEGLQLVMFHATGKKDWEFNPMMLKMVAVFKLEVSKLSCKEHA